MMATSVTQPPAMSSHLSSDKAPKSLRSSGLSAQPHTAGPPGGSYADRYRKIRSLNHRETTAADIQKMIQKSLPKITGSQAEKDRMVVRAVHRSSAINSLQDLPGVPHPAAPHTHLPLTPRRQSLPMKTFHFRVHPEHTSFISKSRPSLPSIPGSPSYPEDQGVSPATQKVPEEKARPSLFPSKHRFEKIVSQKQLHGGSLELSKNLSKASDMKTTASKQHLQAKISARSGFSDPGPRAEPDQPHTSGGVKIRYSKRPAQDRVISASLSEPSYEISRKWKDNCDCLRCQMLKREFQEGDSHYWLWGQYPCHHVDPSVMLDD